MATPREVRGVLKKFRNQVKKASKEIEDVLDLVRELETALETYNADADLDITRGLKAEIRRGKDEIQDLRKLVDKLDNELSDTNRKFHYLET